MTSRLPDHEIAGRGPFTIYLLHGAYGSRQYFADLIAALVGHGYRVVAWDAPGYGLSELPTPTQSTWRQAPAPIWSPQLARAPMC